MQNKARGLRNNNPGNIRINADVFQGEVRPSKDKSFKQFETMAYGYRAMFVDLSSKMKRGVNTIEKIIEIYAPPFENDTEAYINSVSVRSGIARDKILSETDSADYIKIVAAMSSVENGTPAVMSDVECGFKMQNRIR
ncbi:structural protein P5 [Dysgonomonas sp. ZJ279]|uniref:structural protein P5 n=1 Tax=Dysgonomonas sp. ZJ279 TaxID=2709796 RepID=UPI0013EC674E|nr:structural protein P5 [Dysgonomonas sp. ZJ279]